MVFNKYHLPFNDTLNLPDFQQRDYPIVYEENWSLLLCYLLGEANLLLESGVLIPAFQQVNITIIPKKNRSNEIQNQRPISLINSNFKLICAMINKRLVQVLPTLLNKNQLGFRPGQSIDMALYQYYKVVELLKEPMEYNKESSILLIDFEKAFDRFNHNYLKAVLKHVNFGRRMYHCLLAVLCQQQGSLYIIKTLGRSFPMNKGTRQGNPLSPIIFNLMLEPFLFNIQQKCSGITIPTYCPLNLSVKYQAYADDVVLFMNQRDYPIVQMTWPGLNRLHLLSSTN